MYFVTKNDDVVLCCDKYDELFWLKYDNKNNILLTENVMYFDNINMCKLVINTYLLAINPKSENLKIHKIDIIDVESHSNL